jgi:large subunit ribosomal protein L3
MSLNLMGKKRGMTQLFDDKGNSIVCTVIEAEPNVVTQIKTKATDGYDAIQLGFDKIITKDPRTINKRATKPRQGHFARANVSPRRYLLESRLEKVDSYTLGQEIGVEQFDEIKFVDAVAISKGKGYQGVMKLYNYAGGPASHGSGFHRHAGSRGMRSTPGRVLPNGKCATHMGYDRKTVQNLEVIFIDKESNLILLKGSVPGPKNGLVTLSPAIKVHGAKKKSHK